MKKLILSTAMMIMASTAAHADGFLCDNQEGNLRIKVYHHTQPQLGTRNVAVMIVSDPTVADGRKTIATFDADKALLTSSSATYTANVDLRFSTSNRKGENVGGTKLGELDQIILHVDYSFDNPVPAGSEVGGEAVLVRRGSASDIRIPMNCSRYLKGE